MAAVIAWLDQLAEKEKQFCLKIANKFDMNELARWSTLSQNESLAHTDTDEVKTLRKSAS